TVQYIVHQSFSVGKFDLAAVDVPGFFLIDQKKMITTFAAGDVDVFPDLDVSVGAQYGQAAVSPCFQAVGSEPIDPDVAGAAVAAQHNVSEIFELRVLRIMDVSDLRCHDFRFSGSGKEQELVE